ncbi:unnamed protein product, partial [Mesorhabditis spiculigera]
MKAVVALALLCCLATTLVSADEMVVELPIKRARLLNLLGSNRRFTAPFAKSVDKKVENRPLYALLCRHGKC